MKVTQLMRTLREGGNKSERIEQRPRDSSLIGWLDLNEEDQKMAKDYISALRTEGTVDELGFGILRDAFANRFFPATNTIVHTTY